MLRKEIQAKRVLYLTEDLVNLKAQLQGRLFTIPPSRLKLMEEVSTDGIIRTIDGYQDANPARLGNHVFRGIDPLLIGEGEVRSQHFDTVVAGLSFGRGSSREHAQLALVGAGIKLIIAASVERIFAENCTNYGLPVIRLDSLLANKLLYGQQPVDFDEILSYLPPISRMIMSFGGLMPFTQARLSGSLPIDNQSSGARKMTAVERIIANHAGVPFVEPGQQVMMKIDQGYSYELQSAVIGELVERHQMMQYPVHDPTRFYLFEDHLALVNTPAAQRLREYQRNMGHRLHLPMYLAHPEKGISGICHVEMGDQICPGEVVLGNDSHTSSMGFRHVFAVGKGASEMAAAYFTGDILITVPETVRVNLKGQLKPDVTAKDLILHLISQDRYRKQLAGSGRILEISGEGLNTLSTDGQFTLANMATEGQFFTAYIEPNQPSIKEISRLFPSMKNNWENLYSDYGALYAHVEDIDLLRVERMVALPHDPQNAIPISELRDKIEPNIIYSGSCTGGRAEDLVNLVKVLEGQQIHPNIRFFAQAGSQRIWQWASQHGIIRTLQKAGVTFISTGCGACMNMGPGSSKEGETTFSNTNRNYKNRMGRGNTYLGSAFSIARAAQRGHII